MQTSVRSSIPKAFAGLIGDSRRKTVTTGVQAEASAEIPFGVMTKIGATERAVLKMTPVSAAAVIADTVFTAANATETFTAAAHGMSTGDGPVQVSNAGGGLPAGLTALTDYWVIRVTANTFKLATTLANAMAGTNLLITTDGTGVQTLADTASTERITTYGLRGVTVQGHWYQKPDELGTIGLKPFATVGTLSHGVVWVLTENVPLKTDPVHVRAEAFGNQVAGAFRSTADGASTLNLSSFAVWTGRTDTQTAPLVVADKVFTVANATDTATVVAHGLSTGDGPFQVSNAGGGLPTGLVAATNYWVFVTGVDTFKFATTLANAIAGTVVNLTGDGTGVQTIADTASTVRPAWIAELDIKMVNSALAVVTG